MRQRGSCLSQVWWSAAGTALLLLLIISVSSISSSNEHVRAILPNTFRAVNDAVQSPLPSADPSSPNVTVVVASRQSDNTSWFTTALPPHWTITRYITDDLAAEPAVPVNKGHEAMVYLTYLIDTYHALPPITIFSHAQRYQWHNDDPLYDGARLLHHLQLPHVLSAGYVSLRCAWQYGCPAEIHPHLHGDDPAPDPAKFFTEDVKPWFYKSTFQALFPGEPVPDVVGAGCCSQFAVSAARVRARPRADYQRARRWLIETPLPDNVSGRLMEYLWHVLFGMDAVSCPSAEVCYCRVFGKCGLSCASEGACEGQWFLPGFPGGEGLPEGWPERGFEGEVVDVEALRRVQEGEYSV